MKTVFKHTLRLLIFCALMVSYKNVSAQKDTLRIYYSGLQTAVTDSSDKKITKWVKNLKGKKVIIEIYTYYDNGDYKKYMQERYDNLYTVVVRKARDQITLVDNGVKKASKSRRTYADIIWSLDAAANGPEPSNEPEVKKEPATSNASGTPDNSSSNSSSGSTPEKKNETPAMTVQPVTPPQKGDIVYDTTYVNGKMKITKRKVK